MATIPHYKSLYLELQADYIRLNRLTTRLMEQHLNDVKDKEAALESNATKLQSVMATMASSLQAKVAAKKEHKAKDTGTPPAK